MDLSKYSKIADEANLKKQQEKEEREKLAAQEEVELIDKIDREGKETAEKLFSTIEDEAKYAAESGSNEFVFTSYNGKNCCYIEGERRCDDEIYSFSSGYKFNNKCVKCMTRKHLIKMLRDEKINFRLCDKERHEEAGDGYPPSHDYWCNLIIKF